MEKSGDGNLRKNRIKGLVQPQEGRGKRKSRGKIGLCFSSHCFGKRKSKRRKGEELLGRNAEIWNEGRRQGSGCILGGDRNQVVRV